MLWSALCAQGWQHGRRPAPVGGSRFFAGTRAITASNDCLTVAKAALQSFGDKDLSPNDCRAFQVRDALSGSELPDFAPDFYPSAKKNARPGEPERAFDVTPLQGATDGKYHVLVTPVTTEA